MHSAPQRTAHEHDITSSAFIGHTSVVWVINQIFMKYSQLFYLFFILFFINVALYNSILWWFEQTFYVAIHFNIIRLDEFDMNQFKLSISVNSFKTLIWFTCIISQTFFKNVLVKICSIAVYDYCDIDSIQFTFICVALCIMHIASKLLHRKCKVSAL